MICNNIPTSTSFQLRKVAAAKNTLVVLLLSVALTACSSTRTFTLPNDRNVLVESIQVGEPVELLKSDGSSHAFDVRSLNNQQICSDDACFDYSEVDSLSTEHFSLVKTGGAVAGVWTVMAIGAAASIRSIY